MQSRQLYRLALKMAKYRRNHSWRETASHFGILAPDGYPSKGLAKQIVDGYEPKRPVTRVRIGLPPMIPKENHPKINDLFRLPIQDMPAPVLRYALEHREEMRS